MLTMVKKVNLTGVSKVDGQPVENYSCEIDSKNPTSMKYSSWIQNYELYGKNRSACREDRAAFEDAAYELQAQLSGRENE
mgnify:FL=1|jgi:hypothetical protein